MANVLVEESSLQDIADAIRSKNGTQNTYKPNQMADAIEAISGGGITPTGTISITANGTFDVTNYASANVNVPTGGSSIQSGNFTLQEDGKTFTVPLTGPVTHFVFYSENYPAGVSSAWETVGGVWMNNFAQAFVRYNNSNYSVANNMTVTVDSVSLTYTAQYNLIAGVKYYWYAW